MSCPRTLLKAVSAGRTRQVRLLLDLGAATEQADDCGQTPLIRAVFLDNDRNRDKIIKTLLKHGAVVSRVDVVGRNALMWACLYGRDRDVALLLEHGDVDLDYNKVDINGQTALFHAVSSGSAATVKLMVSVLVKYGLTVDAVDFNSTTPLMQAQRLGHDVCESILLYEGNAKVGLSDTNFEISRREKWAVSSLRDRSKVKLAQSRAKNSQFPPIANMKLHASDSPKITNRKLYFGAKIKDSDGESSSSDGEETSKGISPNVKVEWTKNGSSEIVDRKLAKNYATPIRTCLQNIPNCKIPPSVLFSSATNSVVEESGEESEEDSVASTIFEGRPIRGPPPPPADLAVIYSMKQEQMSPSFRKTVIKVDEPLGESDKDITPEATNGNVNAWRWKQLKRNLRLTGVADRKFPPQGSGQPLILQQRKLPGLPGINKEECTPRSKHCTPRLYSNISQNGTQSSENSEKNRNYSEI